MIVFNKNFYSFFSLLTFILIEIANIPYVFNSTLEEVRKGIQEVSYSYYMRGKYIQYNDKKEGFFPPEDATQQNINFLVCTTFTQTVFIELLNISIPGSPESLLSYSHDNLGSPEVIAYSKINKDNNMEMYFYSPGSKNNLTSVINPSLHKDIIPIIEIGDVFTHSTHAFLIYDIERDKDGNIIDAILMESSLNNNAYISSKISGKVTLPSGKTFGNYLDYLFLDSINNTNFKEGMEQGTVFFGKLSIYSFWVNINNTKLSKNEYAILRFIQKDSKGNAVLKYKANNRSNRRLPNDLYYDDIIHLPKKNLDRINKFRHLYIEKIVDKFNEAIVEIGDILVYKIIIKNKSDKDYKYDLIINESLSQYVTYESHSETKKNVSFNYEINNKTLIWNIGKLIKGEEVIISYSVKITSGNLGDTIENIGFVGNILSSTVKNTIGINLDNKKKELIKKNFDKLKNKYNGKKLINEIYMKSFDKNIEFDKFDITKLIINKELNSTSLSTIYLNINNSFYGAVLNKHWSTLAKTEYSYTNEEKVDIYDLKTFWYYKNPERRQDFIYLENFQTGDILIYINNNDIIYSVDKDKKLVKQYITYENGEYSYIYIEGRGFVGVNLGTEKNNNLDRRNEFNAKYYKDNNINIMKPLKNNSDYFVEMVNLQTLFGKDYYVILRPSLLFEFKYNNNSTNLAIIIISIIIVIIFIISIGIIILKYRRNKLKKNKDDILISNAEFNLMKI